MIKDFVKSSKYYLGILLILLIAFLIIKNSMFDVIQELDNSLMNFIQNHVVRDSFTFFFKITTNLGGVLFFVILLSLVLVMFKNKRVFGCMSLNLLFTYLFSVIFKNCFRRERPLINLIEKPHDYSFPSGHTMCSVAFYGFLIYLIFRYIDNKVIKFFLISFCFLVIVVIGFSRIYLNVHYLSDVLSGVILGFVCLLMFINYVRMKNII